MGKDSQVLFVKPIASSKSLKQAKLHAGIDVFKLRLHINHSNM